MDGHNVQTCEECGEVSYVTLNHLCEKCARKKENIKLIQQLADYIIYQDLKEKADRGKLNDKGFAAIMLIQENEDGRFITKPKEALDVISKLRNNLGIKEVKNNESDS